MYNPFGILYNPYSISNSIHRVLENKFYEPADYHCYADKYINFDLHGKYSNHDLNAALIAINDTIAKAHQFILHADCIIITFGTAWIYQYQNKIVANCHKVEQSKFTKRLLTINEIVTQFNHLIETLLKTLNHVKIIFTVSPVRHLRDGFTENQLSKSTLHLAIHELIKLYPQIEYFPAYEIQMDDLRDYRFCKEDMIHPSEQAVEYIWQKFVSRYFSEQTINLIEEYNKLYRLKNHQVISKDNKELEKHKEKIDNQEKLIAHKIQNMHLSMR
jgi:hypothetical protein